MSKQQGKSSFVAQRLQRRIGEVKERLLNTERDPEGGKP